MGKSLLYLKNLVLALCLALFAATPAFAQLMPKRANPADCARNYETMGVRRIETFFEEFFDSIDVSHAIKETWVKDLKVIDVSEVLGNTKNVFIGFGEPNVYLVIGDGKGGYTKFSGKSLKRGPAFIEHPRRGVQSGVLVNFKELPDEVVDKLLEAMKKYEGKKYWTCVNAVCRVLDDSGFTVGEKPLSDRYFPVSLLRAIAKDGFQIDGKDAAVDVIRTTTAEMEAYALSVLKAELKTPYRHAARAISPIWNRYRPTMAIAVAKNAKQKMVSIFFGAVERAPDAKVNRILSTLPNDQKYVEDLDVTITKPSKVGMLLRTIWGPHTLFKLKQARVNVDDYLIETLKPFPKENPDFVTKLKKHFLFSPAMVSNIRKQMAKDTHDVGKLNEREVHAMLGVDTPETPNKMNIVISKDGVSIARISVRHKFVDWILSKHVLISGYDPDVRFAGEIWKDAEGRIHLNSNSGTYKPTNEQLEAAGAYLRQIFPNVEIVTHGF